MKQLILSLTLLLFAAGLLAQNSANEKAIQEETAALVALYKLDEAQAEKMLVIQQRRFRNLAEIETLKSKDEVMYLQKMKSIRKGTEASIKRMLNTEQLSILNTQIAERRKLESDLVKEMRLKGASKEEIQLALLGLE